MRHAALLLCLVLVACSGKLDHEKLAGAVRDLHAFAAESRLLLTLRDEGGTTRAYARVQRGELLKKIGDTNKDLAKGVDRMELEPLRSSAEALGHTLEDVVGKGEHTAALDVLVDKLALLDAELRP